LASLKRSGTTVTVQVNSSTGTATNSTNVSGSTKAMVLGVRTGSESTAALQMIGNVTEILLFNNVTNFSNIESNMNTYYTVY
jgi:hypothetical protein